MPSSPRVCTKCKKLVQYASVCRTKISNDSATGNKSSGRKRGLGETKHLEYVVEEDTENDEVLGIFVAKNSGKNVPPPPNFKSVMLDQNSCKMQLDTGAIVFILPKVLYDLQFNKWPLRSTEIK